MDVIHMNKTVDLKTTQTLSPYTLWAQGGTDDSLQKQHMHQLCLFLVKGQKKVLK